MRYLVHRKDRDDCIVSIMFDRRTNCFCFVNLTKEHVCSCRFNSIREALADMDSRDDVLSYEPIPTIAEINIKRNED